MRECGNVRMARCPLGPAHSALCLEAAFLLVPGGRGMKEGTGGLDTGLGSNSRKAAEDGAGGSRGVGVGGSVIRVRSGQVTGWF